MFTLLFDPVKEIKKAKKQSYAKILLYLLTGCLFETIGLLFFAWKYLNLTPDMLVMGVFASLAFFFGAHLLVAFFFSFAMHILDGKAGYYEGITCLTLAFIAPAISTFFAGALAYLPFGIYPAILFIVYGYTLGIATLIRSTKELFNLDYAGVWLGFLATVIPLCIAGCLFTIL
jgi:hypothetical protein